MNPQLTQDFHKQFYQSINWRKDLSYRGVPILKNPLDLFIEQQIIWETKPDIIIETGTAFGGSALYYADLLQKMEGKRFVITVDVQSSRYTVAPDVLVCPRIILLDQGSLDKHSIDYINAWVQPDHKVMVILDSDHHMDHVYAELKAYSKFVTPGCYLVVEDTNTDLVLEGYGPSGRDAVDDFLNDHVEFQDFTEKCSPFGFTFNSWLRRVK